jgi:hypothetical protein
LEPFKNATRQHLEKLKIRVSFCPKALLWGLPPMEIKEKAYRVQYIIEVYYIMLVI